MKVLAVIPARGGSKSIPHKNIVSVGGKPLIAWTIEEAQRSKHIDRLIVSTDSDQIAEIAVEYGAEVPFKRPAELAADDTPGIEPIIHAVRWLEENQEYKPDCVMCLTPTSPLRSSADIDIVVELMDQKGTDAVVSVVLAKHHPYWMKSISSTGFMLDFLAQEDFIPRRQELPPVYALNGSIYLARREILLEKRTWYTSKTYAYVMPEDRSIDIDSQWDLKLATLMMQDRIGQ